jgi:hypothetical protein
LDEVGGKRADVCGGNFLSYGRTAPKQAEEPMDLAPLVQRLKDEIDNDWKQVTGSEIEEAKDSRLG